MKWFYILAGAGTLLLSLAPLVLLPNQEVGQKPGEIVSYGVFESKVKSLDPATCGDVTSAIIQGAIYEAPYAYHFLKRPVELIPELAESMPEISPDGLTYTFHIKKGVQYTPNPCFGANPDGSPKTRTMTAGDFVLTFKRIADYHVNTESALAFIEDKVVGLKEFRDQTRTYEKGDFSRYNLPLAGVEALDEYTFRVRLKLPFPQLVYVMAMTTFAPFPREIIDYYFCTKDDDRGGRENIPVARRSAEVFDFHAAVGTGPYYLSDYVEGSRMILRRNPAYRTVLYPSEGSPGDREAGLLADAGKKLPLVDVRYLTFVEESNPMWMLFLTNQSDTARIPQEMYSSIIGPNKELLSRWTKENIQLWKYTSPDVFWLGFNMQDRVLGASKSLRQAMCLAFNVEQYIDVIYNGRGIRAVNYIPSSFEAHDEAGPSPYARYDLAEARRKIDQAKKELVAAGVLQPGENIPPITLDLGGRDENSRRMGEFAQQQFRKIGIDLRVELNDWPTLQDKFNNKKSQMFTLGWSADYPDPENFLQLYYSPNIARTTNTTNYSNPEFDALYRRAAVMPPSPQRRELYVKMIRLLNEDCPVLLLSEPVAYSLAHSWVHNIKPAPFGYTTWKYLRIDADQRRREGGR